MKDKNEALRAIPLFRDLGEKDLADIAGLLIDRKFPKEAVIYEDGSIGDYMYIIQEGQVKVTKMSEDGREKILEILGPGDFHGEMALLDRAPRSASVKTTTPCVLLALSRQDFLGLLKQNHEVTLELIRVLARRLRETDEQIKGLLFERVEGRTRRLLARLAKEPVTGRD
ncbi:MAG TPA: Crp/Fnr family transcriptional regulator, partial [Myxococcota bacterium]|nr:Crp/Fnr family transcriptional regulator [Myxococcota bacterium]